MTNDPATAANRGGATAQKIDAFVWGGLLIWIGVALLAGFGWGIGLLGVGIILLGDQLAKKLVTGRVEPFWIVVGVVFLIGGVSELLSFHVSLIPVACVVAGLTLVLSALLRKQPA